jgi:hypothetical protein
VVQLWHANNYHWYLKKELSATILRQGLDSVQDAECDLRLDAIVSINWDQEDANVLRVLHADGVYTALTFCWDWATISPGLHATNPCLAGGLYRVAAFIIVCYETSHLRAHTHTCRPLIYASVRIAMSWV